MGTMIKSKAQNQSLFGGSMMALNNTNDDDSESSNEKAPTVESKSKNGLFDDLLCREVGFIMLQLVNGLKMMQAKGVEDMPLSLSNIIMCRELEKETQARLCILQGWDEKMRLICPSDLINFYFRLNPDITRDDEDEMGTLCQCALKAVKDFLPETKLTQIISHLLAQERSDTLSK